MAATDHIQHPSLDLREDSQTGHWLPALRPDTIDESHDVSHVYDALKPDFDSSHSAHANIDIIPPTPVSKQEDQVKYTPNHVSDIPESPGEPGTEHVSHAQPTDPNLEGNEIPWDDDNERLDPAWGIKRLDSTHILDTVHRSTTFPEFIPSEVSNREVEHAAPDIEQEVDLVNGDGVADHAVRQDKQIAQSTKLDWLGDGQDVDGELESWTVPAREDPPNDADQRFEEGLPLMHAEEDGPVDTANQEEQLAQNPFDTPHDDEDASFFANTNGTAPPASGNFSLGRKSTAQVLNSLNIADKDLLDSPAIDAPPEASFFDELATHHEHVPDDKIPADAGSQDVDAMWAAALGDDEFLVEDADDLLPDSEPSSPVLKEESLLEPSLESASGAAPQLTQRQSSVNPYAPHQPSTSDMFHLSSTTRTTHNNVGLTRPELAPLESFQAQLPPRPPPQSVKSFVDQAKDGYKSPYDLPMELSKSKKRSHVPQPVQTAKPMAPPPRSSSLSEKPLPSAFASSGPPTSDSDVMPPMQLQGQPPSMPGRSVSAFTPAKSATPKSGSSSGFFEELPVTSRHRPAGRYTPQQSISAAAPPLPLPQSPPAAPLPPSQQVPSPPRASDPYAQYQLQAPERLDPYANVPLQPPPSMPVSTSMRYSPAPPAAVVSSLGPRTGPSPRYSPAPPTQTVPVNASRYAAQPTPPPAPTQPPQTAPSKPVAQLPPAAAAILPFQPRTSSPLAYHQNSVDERAENVLGATAQLSGPPAPTNQYTPSTASASYSISSPQRGGYGDLTNQLSPPKRADGGHIPPPRRSQTQSPSKQRPQAAYTPNTSEYINRPATAFGQSSPSVSSEQLASIPPTRPNVKARGLVPELDFVRPHDDTQFDPLERWKGAPLFNFGFGGTLISTFPRHIPRYAAGAARPQIKSAPGEVSIRNFKDILPQNELVNTFPGPLRSKSKKKQLLSWMSNYITGLEAGMPNIFATQSHDDPARRHHEKVLLWKIVRVMVEHDASLEGPALKAINLILSPEVHNVDESSPIQYRAGETSSGIYRPSGANVRPDSIDPMAIETLRKTLLSGDRQGAVYQAMDNRLWSHALILASNMERSMWGHVVREFVRQEVNTAGENTETLSALYEIFAGNLEESIDELVPPSARAGVRMVSRADTGGPTKNALDGLNRWKETLALVLNNRSQGDHQALMALGKLLQDYGRIEAAHICYLFSRNPQRPALFGGYDDEHTAIVLLGANNKGQPSDFGRDLDAILLTEIYEYASCILAPGSPMTWMPHLVAFKMHRATLMAEEGLKGESQSYCDAIAATEGKSSKLSPYYNTLLLSELRDLQRRLKLMPIQSSSWMGNPSLEKVGDSLLTKFSSFVSGDNSDAESKGSGKDAVDTGPFAHVAGTPSVSRTGSQPDLYASYPQAIPATMAGSRYAPNGIQSARSSAELARGRPSLDSQRSPPSTSYSQNNHQYEPMNMFQQGHVALPTNPYQNVSTASPPTSFPQSPPRSSYMPNSANQPMSSHMAPMRPEYNPTPPSEDVIHQAYGYTTEPIMGSQIPEEQPMSFGGYQPSQPDQAQIPLQHDEMIDTGYDGNQSYGFQPPTGDYVPYVPEPDSPEANQELKPKKKSFMDDDDDDAYPRASHQSGPSQSNASASEDEAARKRANDAAADAAFRAAAEADAARAKEKKESKRSSSWFGGWLGGKKDEGLDAGSGKGGDQKVYKAKLGESKMKLYYDKDLGKWVNPDNPDAAKKTATPPPPRMGGTPAPPMGAGGPPRAPMGSTPSFSNPNTPNIGTGLSSGPPSRVGTPADGPGPSLPSGSSPHIGITGPPSAASTPPMGPPSTPGLAPPPRPATAMSNASSIDDLIGPATGRKTAKGGRKGGKGRYVDVMAK